MKLSYYVIALICISILFSVQTTVLAQKKAEKPELDDVSYVLNHSTTTTVAWYSYYVDKIIVPLTAVKTTEEVSKDLDAYLVKAPSGDNKGEYTDKQFALITKYKQNLDSTFRHFTNRMQTLSIKRFFYNNEISLLINFNLKDNKLSLIIAGGDVDLTFQRKSKTAEQRAQLIITSYILPALAIMASDFPGNDIKNFGMTIVYGTYKLGNDYAAEWVGFIAAASDIRKYGSGKMTEAKLIDAGEIHVSNPDDITLPTKKLTLKYTSNGLAFDAEHPDTMKFLPAVKPPIIYYDKTFTLERPASWKDISEPDNTDNVEFEIDNHFVFWVDHLRGYDDIKKAANVIRTEIKKKGGTSVIEKSMIGEKSALKVTENITVDGIDAKYIYFLFNDEDQKGKKITTIEYMGHVSDFDKYEPECIKTIKSIKFE